MDQPAAAPKAGSREQLSQISYLAVKTPPNDFPNVLRLAEYLQLWAQEAKKSYGPWTTSFLLQANQVIKGLKAGRPVNQGWERILKALLDADKQLAREAEKAGMPVPGTEVLVFDPESKTQKNIPELEAPGFLKVKEEDLPGLRDFLQEAPSHYSAIEEGLLHAGGKENWDILKIYRPFHTLKSLFGYLGFPGLGDLSHQAETLLEPYKKSGDKPSGPEVELLLKALDLFRLQTNRIREGLAQGQIEICPIPPLFGNTVPGNAPAVVPQAAVPVPADTPEEEEKIIRIDTGKMDELMETLEEWITYQTRIQMMAQDSPEYFPLSGTIERMGKIARKLQDQVVSLRMVPIQPLFSRIGRVARDLSQKTGKTVRLELEGANTSLDKRLVDELWEPVLHLVRNAVDHGLESAGERAKKGKNSQGGLWVKAWHQEGHFILSIRDDGRGLDARKIEKKARALGWLEEGKELELDECQEMIFRPGFSTLEKASNVSGRGIGLDLVRRRLQALKGWVEVATVPDEGCLFIMRIPLTLALLDGLLIRVGTGLYIIPLSQIQKFSLLAGGDSAFNRNLPGFPRKINLAEWFGSRSERSNNLVGIQLETDKGQILLMADEILGKREIVLKGLNPILGKLKGINGGAILGDGRVALVLDIQYLAREITRAADERDQALSRSLGKGDS